MGLGGCVGLLYCDLIMELAVSQERVRVRGGGNQGLKLDHQQTGMSRGGRGLVASKIFPSSTLNFPLRKDIIKYGILFRSFGFGTISVLFNL